MAKDHIKIEKNTLIMAVIFLIVLFFIFYFFSNNENITETTDNDFIPEKTNKVQQPVDTDGDGLTDIKEKEIGTNPQLYDTDGDMLSDYKEYYETKTDPLNKNTDGDRYDDNEDSDPLNKNSAKIGIRIGDSKIQLNYVNIGILVLTGGLSYNSELYSTEVDVEVENVGNDYTSYLNYDLVLLIGNEVIDKETVSLGKLNQGQVIIKHFSFSTTLADIPSNLISYITEQVEPTVEVRNGDYEKF